MTTAALPRALLVTGGGRGIGASIVRLAVAQGWDVAVNFAQDAASAQALVDSLQGTGRRAVALQGDVADPGDVERLFDQAEAAIGPLGALVNNAGITGPIGPFIDAGVDTLRRVFDVNVLGTMLCAQAAARRWIARGVGGRMVNLSSLAAVRGSANDYVHYAASKGAVDSFSIGLARELAPRGIRVNVVSPGMTRTGIHAAAGDAGRLDRAAPAIPMRRPGEPDEIAEAVLWLLDDRASYVAGAILRVDGAL